jgi:hypothetical protein
MKFDTRSITVALLLVVVAVLIYAMATTPEHRTPGQKMGAAIDRLDEGVSKAGHELQDRTPAERLRDNLNDTTNGNRR